MKKTIIQKFHKTDKFRHIEVPFEVPENIDTLEIKIIVHNKTDEDCVIDIGVRDPIRVRGWTGSNKRHLVITKYHATPGYFQGEIQKGIWAVLLSAYKVPKNGCEVTLEITLAEKHFRWIKGDTHMHTVHSDGDSPMHEMVKACSELGYDYLVSTEHNTLTMNPLLPTDMGMLMIPGVELTTYHGHAHLLGLNEPFSDFRCNNKKDILDKFSQTKAQGGFVGINHPNASDCEGCTWDWGFDLPHDWIEVWNSLWSFMNQRTLDYWQSELCKGKRIPVIAGSDNHRLLYYKTMPLPVTHVFVDSLDHKAVLEGFTKGNVFISIINGPVIDMRTENNVLGEVTTDKKIHIDISELKPMDKIRIVSNKGVESEFVFDSKKKFELEFNRTNQSFVRTEVSRHNKFTDGYDIALLTNPIYFEQ